VTDVREVCLSDAATLFELLSDPSVAEYVSSPPPSAEAFAGFVAWTHQRRAAAKGVCFGIVPHGLDSAVGIIQVRALDAAFLNAEWGFAIAEPFWGTGVFIDAANLVAEFVFTTLKVHRIEARAVCKNGRGNGALQKLGAQPEARLEQSFHKDGQFDRQFLWTLCEEDWRQRPLVREPFSPLRATERIADAVRQTKRLLEEHKEHNIDGVDGGAPYPFFLTDSGT